MRSFLTESTATKPHDASSRNMGAGRGLGRSGGLTDRLMTYAQRVVAGSLALVSFAGVTYIGLAFAEMVQAGAGRRTHTLGLCQLTCSSAGVAQKKRRLEQLKEQQKQE